VYGSTLASNVTTVIGYQAGPSTTGNDNTGVGYRALYQNTSGTENVAVGTNALQANTTASDSVAVGRYALYSSNGIQNTSVGANTLYSNTSGINNTGCGQSALYSNSTGSGNTAVGQNAGSQLLTSNHVVIGRNANTVSTTGDRCTVVGASANPSAFNTDAEIVIGYAVIGQGDSYITMGANTGKIYNAYKTNATWTQTSDGRLKKNIQPDSLGLSFLCRLNPVTYQWKPSNEIDPSLPYYSETNERDTETVMHGFVAQEVKEALDAEGCSTFNGWDAGNHDGIQAISREMFISPLVKSIQELKAIVDAQAVEIADLKAKVA
jgi:hypothetical protein